jgi:hypothetical protein
MTREREEDLDRDPKQELQLRELRAKERMLKTKCEKRLAVSDWSLPRTYSSLSMLSAISLLSRSSSQPSHFLPSLFPLFLFNFF